MSIGLAIDNIQQKFTVDTAKIAGQGGPESPQLVIPVNFVFTPYQKSAGHPHTQFDIIHIDGELFLSAKNFKASQLSKAEYLPIWQRSEQTLYLYFPLTREMIFHIEKGREGNLPGSLRVHLQVAHHSNPPPINSSAHNEPSTILRIDTAGGHDDFIIELSRWVSNVLPGLGHQAASLIELPMTAPLLPQEYAIALPHLTKAREYFLNSDYDKTISHCRIALEKVYRQFPKKKDQMPSDERFQWLKDNMSGTYSFAESIVVSNHTMSNNTHHADSCILGRPEAETILHMTTLILAYVGKILPESIPDKIPPP